MKRLLLLPLLLSAAGMPLSATAFDYGTQRLLAVEAGAPSLPMGHGNEAFADSSPQRAQGGGDDVSAPAATPTIKRSAPRAATARRNIAPNVAAPGPGAGSPHRAQSALSWQSLLPGSIQ